MPLPTLHGGLRLLGELWTLLYLGLISAISMLPGASCVFFPELGALAHDVFTRPRGAWASAPWFLALTPVLTGVLGVACALMLPYGYLSMLLIVAVSVALVRGLRSPIAPAISAGVLPLVLELKSWWYPPAILLGTAMLALLSWAWRDWCLPRMPLGAASHRERVDDVMELAPRRWTWTPVLFAFLLAGITLVKQTGLRLIVFPPLVVIAFEMFAHPSVCPWAKRPLRLPLACFLAASVGLIAVSLLGTGVLTTMLSLAAGICILRLLDLHIPPALAVALIPQVLHDPSWHYPLAVLTGTALLTGHFLLYRAWLQRHRTPR